LNTSKIHWTFQKLITISHFVKKNIISIVFTVFQTFVLMWEKNWKISVTKWGQTPNYDHNGFYISLRRRWPLKKFLAIFIWVFGIISSMAIWTNILTSKWFGLCFHKKCSKTIISNTRTNFFLKTSLDTYNHRIL